MKSNQVKSNQSKRQALSLSLWLFGCLAAGESLSFSFLAEWQSVCRRVSLFCIESTFALLLARALSTVCDLWPRKVRCSFAALLLLFARLFFFFFF